MTSKYIFSVVGIVIFLERKKFDSRNDKNSNQNHSETPPAKSLFYANFVEADEYFGEMLCKRA